MLFKRFSLAYGSELKGLQDRLYMFTTFSVYLTLTYFSTFKSCLLRIVANPTSKGCQRNAVGELKWHHYKARQIKISLKKAYKVRLYQMVYEASITKYKTSHFLYPWIICCLYNLRISFLVYVVNPCADCSKKILSGPGGSLLAQ